MTYWGEFRAGWRALLATALAMGTGMSTTGIVTSIMAPHFIKEFAWSPADFAKVGAVSILLSIFVPIAGRMADVLGVRKTAAIGVTVAPLCMIALAHMTGNITQYYVLFIIQAALCVTTTATVYSRVIVTHFQQARGLALAIAASAPGVAGIFAGLFLNPFVEGSGWRAGYLVVAAITFGCGVIALLMMPSPRTAPVAETSTIAGIAKKKRSWEDYPAIFRTRAFWVLIIAMILCNLYQTLVLTQLNLLILSKGIDKMAVGQILSAFSVSMVIGRFICGGAIDRLPGQIVAAIGMGLPAVGLFLMASHLQSYEVVLVSMVFIGFAVGAEGDLIGVLVARAFGVAVYSSVMGLVTGAISLATSSGAFLLSMLLAGQQGYTSFLLLTGVTTVVGGVMFLALPKAQAAAPEAESL